MSKKKFYVYIMTNRSAHTLYTGITNNLIKRIYEHKNKLVKGFTAKYNINKLVYYEEFSSPYEAIAAEKRIKGWVRKKKMALVKSQNPLFDDLSKDF